MIIHGKRAPWRVLMVCAVFLFAALITIDNVQNVNAQSRKRRSSASSRRSGRTSRSRGRRSGGRSRSGRSRRGRGTVSSRGRSGGKLVPVRDRRGHVKRDRRGRIVYARSRTEAPARPRVKPGSEIPATRVNEIQQALSKQGYYTGTPSGTYDENTMAAMRSFQSAHNLKPTGLPTAQTLMQLGLAKNTRPSGAVQPPKTEPATTRPRTVPGGDRRP